MLSYSYGLLSRFSKSRDFSVCGYSKIQPHGFLCFTAVINDFLKIAEFDYCTEGVQLGLRVLKSLDLLFGDTE